MRRGHTTAAQMLYVRVGEAIYKARHNECLTRRELGKRVGVTEGHLQNVEEGVTPCSLHLLVAVADELDLSLDELVPVAIDAKELTV